MNKDKQGNAYKEKKRVLETNKKRFFSDIINRLKLSLMRKQVIHSLIKTVLLLLIKTD